MDVPNSLKTTSPHLYGSGYETGRKQHSQKMTRLFQQPLPQYMYSTNGIALIEKKANSLCWRMHFLKQLNKQKRQGK